MISRLQVIRSNPGPSENLQNYSHPPRSHSSTNTRTDIGATQIKSSNLKSKVQSLRPLPDPDAELYAVAMLKVAMELKRDKNAGFEQIFENTLAAMQVDRQSFRAYLERNLTMLKTTVQKRGY